MKYYTSDEIMSQWPKHHREEMKTLLAKREWTISDILAEPKIADDDAIALAFGMLDEREAQLCCLDMSESLLMGLTQKFPEHPDITCCYECIVVGRRYLVGEATIEELVAARKIVKDYWMSLNENNESIKKTIYLAQIIANGMAVPPYWADEASDEDWIDYRQYLLLVALMTCDVDWC
jgi:hypothetical protein